MDLILNKLDNLSNFMKNDNFIKTCSLKCDPALNIFFLEKKCLIIKNELVLIESFNKLLVNNNLLIILIS